MPAPIFLIGGPYQFLLSALSPKTGKFGSVGINHGAKDIILNGYIHFVQNLRIFLH
jgi:hypothetical protein